MATRKSAPTRGRSAAKKSTSRSRSSAPVRRKNNPPSPQAYSLLLFCLGLIMFAMAFVPGEAAWSDARDVLLGLFGFSIYLLGALLIYLAVLLVDKKPIAQRVWRALAVLFVFSGLLVAFSDVQLADKSFTDVLWALYWHGQDSFWGSGVLCGALGGLLVVLCGRPAANLLLIVLLIACIMWFARVTPADLWALATQGADKFRQKRAQHTAAARAKQAALPEAAGKEPTWHPQVDIPLEEDGDSQAATAPEEEVIIGPGGTFGMFTGSETPSVDSLIAKAVEKKSAAVTPDASGQMTLVERRPDAAPEYHYPPLSLFDSTKHAADKNAAEEMKKNADLLVKTLESFGVRTRILDVSRGPSVTRYELQPLAGVKISRITSLADDIALNLSAAGVRIEAPIPGKPAVGIEVPNRKSTAVGIRGLFESRAYRDSNSPLKLALGRDIAGEVRVADLCKMPHLLIAGSTGSGKSVCVNSIIISFLYSSSPEDVKLILIDPKVVELAEYNGIPHLLMPVVTEPRKAAGALGSAVAEMERRYHLFAENNVRDIKTFNRLAAKDKELEKLPYIAIVIDELADLMMVAGKDVEDSICRIAQKARAAGMHLIVATQRPSVDVITGLIKANIPSRIAFAVSSQVDSRTILDSGGAEKLLGMGDMLFLPVGASKPVRIQGTYVTDEEISSTLEFIKKDSASQYNEAMIAEMERHAEQTKGSDTAEDETGGDYDSALPQAVDTVIEAGQASTSLLQRRCKLGYARAARIMDEMEQLGVIGPYQGAKPRDVLVTRQQWIEMQQRRDG